MTPTAEDFWSTLSLHAETDEVILAGHFRVTVSADGTKAERVDALSKSLLPAAQ